jgi:predicted nuclease of predicted toxin-antitoxin system
MMRILFDQGTPVPIRDSIHGHTVKTAWDQGWDTLSNGELLKAAENADFDVLVTTDQNLARQQNLTGHKIAVVVLTKANWRLIKPVVPQIVAAILAAQPGTFTVVPIQGQ